LALDPAHVLAPNWGQYFLPLDERDLRAPMRDEIQPSEGRTEYAWIWITPRPPPLPSTLTASTLTVTPPSDPQLTAPASSHLSHKTLDADSQDFDRVQWAKCQARAERYEEEVQLTVEEMGRTLQYFKWKRDWWIALVPQCSGPDTSPDIQDGLRAYAHRQSNLYNELVTLFVVYWRPYLSAHSLGVSWLGEYVSRVDPTPVRPSRRGKKTDTSSAAFTANVPSSFKVPTNPSPLVDAPLDSGSDNDSDGYCNGADAEGDDYIETGDMFADD
jgi:hypothetical protein